jgi:hypothetical protein
MLKYIAFLKVSKFYLNDGILKYFSRICKIETLEK